MFCQGGQWEDSRVPHQEGMSLGSEPGQDRENGGGDCQVEKKGSRISQTEHVQTRYFF